MNRKVQLSVVALGCAAMVACTNLRVVADGSEASSNALRRPQPVLEPRDIAVITTADGQRIEMQVTSIDDRDVVGVVDNQAQPVRIPISQIQRVERRELDGVKTTLAVLIPAILLYIWGRRASDSFVDGAFGAR